VTAGPGERIEFTGVGSNGNAGTIEANGGEIAFAAIVRNQEKTGLITGRDATLRFNGGLDNGGSLALTAGISDVHGDITNGGTIALGARAQAIFHDDVKQSGTFIIPTAASATMLGEYSGGGFTGGGELVILGDLRPGFSPAVTLFDGDLTLGPSAATEIDIQGLVLGQFDQVNVTGRLALGGSLSVLLGSSFNLGLGQSFQIFTAGGGVSGQFAGLADGALVGTFGGEDLFIDYATNGIALYTAPVPEPGTYAMILAGLAVAGWAAGQRADASSRAARHASPADGYCRCTPAARITRAQRSPSCCRNAANSPGVLPMAVAPATASRCCVCGLASAARSASLTRLTTDAGVPAGAKTPTHGAVSWKPGKPASAMVGTEGNSGWRLAVAVASTLSRFCDTFAATPIVG
jgi:hypothetical protein